MPDLDDVPPRRILPPAAIAVEDGQTRYYGEDAERFVQSLPRDRQEQLVVIFPNFTSSLARFLDPGDI